ncbi:MAG: arylesterase [Hyphomicrobium sp.]
MKAVNARRNWHSLAKVVALLAVVNMSLGAAKTSIVGPGPAKPIRIVAFGDSLTAGFGLKPRYAFPAQLQKALKARGHNVVVANAGVSGDTTAAGLERLAWAVPDGTDAIIVEFGGNDALRGIDPKVTRANLEKIISSLKQRNMPILLAGIRAPANWGEDYSKAFDAIFPDLAQEHGLVFYPFFLEGVVLNPKLNLNDGLHPSSKGIAEIVKRIVPSVEELIDRASTQRASASKGQ